MKCPECGEDAERETVDVGVGEEIPCGPWGCFACGWVEEDWWIEEPKP